jgi:serine/threonine protein kinase
MKYNSANNRQSRFSTTLRYTFIESEYYVPFETYIPTKELRELVKSLLPENWQFDIKAIWTEAIPPYDLEVVQGWKIHVSCIKKDAIEVLSTVVKYCASKGIRFKFLSDYKIFQLTNSKAWNRGGSGKFITIYPQTTEIFKSVIQNLSELLGQNYVGPYILSDKRSPTCPILYYRYGGFKLLVDSSITSNPYIVQPDGTQYLDTRGSSYVLPPWVEEVFNEEADEETHYLDKRFVITEALHFSNTGGVYLANDLNNDELEIVIKEARPHTCIDDFGADSVANLNKEYQILQLLESGSYTPRPFMLFHEWEHTFLAMEKIEGITLSVYVSGKSLALQIQENQNNAIQYYKNLIKIFINTLLAIKWIHEKGIIRGDISQNNIFINPDTLDIKIIDFEGAKRVGIDNDSKITTHGFTGELRKNSVTMEFFHDLNSIGLTFAALILPINNLVGIKPDYFNSAMKVVEKNMFIPNGLINIISDLIKQNFYSDEIINYINRLEKTSLDLQKEYEKYLHNKSKNIKSILMGFSVEDILAFNDSVVNFEKRSRPYPVFAGEHEPFSIAFGALGVLYTKYLVLNSINQKEENWILNNFDITSNNHGLYTGLSGASWALYEMGYHDISEKLFQKLLSSHTLFQNLDIYSGAAGTGLCALHLWEKTHNELYLNHAHRVGRVIKGLVYKNTNGISWFSEDEEIPVGYAHGGSGIALFLLYLGITVDDPSYVELGLAALQHDLSYGSDSYETGVISFPESSHSKSIVFPYWRWGSAGIGTTALRFWAHTQDSDLFKIIQNLIPDTQRWYSVSPGLNNGLAGLANFSIDVYQFTQDKSALEAAHKTLATLEMYKINKESGVAFPGDFLFRICTDFATGSSGVALVLDRLKKNRNNFNFTCDNILRKR